MDPRTAFLSLIVALFIGVAGYLLGYSKADVSNSRARFTANWSDTMNLRKQGSMIGVGNYDFRSFDGGQHWYSVEMNKNLQDTSVRIIGPADPVVMTKVDGFQALIDHVQAHGPIHLEATRPGDLEALSDAGFTVTELPPIGN